VDLEPLAELTRHAFEEKAAARDRALVAGRRSIRFSANAIRAVHRGDLNAAHDLMEQSRAAIKEGRDAVLAEHPDVYFAGFLQDAQKEYAEARLTEAIVTAAELPSPEDLDVELAPYLNGMGEAIGEGRRAVLDRLRRGEIEESERILEAMDELYDLLVTVDFPDAMTRNLRRTTDAARAIMERTRGDLSISLVQRNLQEALERHATALSSRAEDAGPRAI
jgi:translin